MLVVFHICFFLFQAKKVVQPSSMSKGFTIWDPAEPNLGLQARIKGGEEVNVFKKLVYFIKKRHHRRSG